MEWNEVLETNPDDVETNKTLLDDLFTFLIHNQFPGKIEEAPPQLQENENLLKLLLVLRNVAKEKGLDAQAAEDELRELHSQHETTRAQLDTSEQDLVDKVVELEKELRLKDDTIERLRQQLGTSSPSVAARQVRHLKEEVEDLSEELTELKRSLGQERVENQRLMQSASSERLKSRQLEREVDNMRHNLDDYRKQLDWQREQGGGTGGKGTVEADCRERLWKKDLEMAQQLDKIEELLNARDSLEEQLREVTVQLGHVEEQRLVALKDNEAIKSALVESDSRCDELDTKNKLLEGKVVDLQEQLTQQTVTDDHIVNLVHTRAQEWEGILVSKEEELGKCRVKIRELEGQLKAAEQHSNRTNVIKMKKELQSREGELVAMQKELAEATAHITTMNSQLEQLQGRGDTGLFNSALKQELEHAQVRVKALENDLALEVSRREQAEVEKEERDVELTQALGRLGEYERGEYGLHEAVLEIKVKKEELAVRDKDIAELTQDVNRLEGELNLFSEENEALRDKLGLGRDDSVDVSGVRGRRVSELDKLRKENRMLENQVEHLEEDKLNLRKQLLDQAITKRTAAHHDDVDMGAPSHASSLLEMELKVRELERRCQEERRGTEAWQSDAQALKGRLKQAQEKLKQMKTVVKELKEGQDLKKTRIKSEALDRLIALLEVEGSGNDVALVLQLKSQLSEQIGQNEVMSQQIQRVETEARHALKELERKQCELESVNKELLTLKKLQSGFQPLPLPEGISPSSGDVITSLNEQLLHTLHQLHSRECALGEARTALEKLQRKFAVVIHQQGVLYLEYKESRSKWDAERELVMKEREKLIAERDEDKIKTHELENLQASLAGGEEGVQRRLGEMSRKLTLLQISEKTLVRKQQLLQEVEAGLRKENSQLHHDKVRVEKAVTEKIAYLQRHKETALFKLNSLQQQLTDSIPAEEMDKANQQYNELAIKYQQLLSQQTSYTATTASVERLQAEVHTLTHQLDEVKQELTLEKKKSQLMVDKTSSGEKDSLRATSSEGRGQLGTLEMQVLNERQRAELANVRWQQLQSVVTQLEQRNVSLEEKFSELTQRLLVAQMTEGDLRDQLASSLPQSEKASLEESIVQLKKSEAKLVIDNNHLKEVAEIARQQAIAMEMVQKSNDLEVGSLRHQLLDLQSGSEERTATGRLHHQLLALQVSEAMALKRHEEAEAKILKLEVNLLQAERQRSKESEAIFQCRAESASRVKHLRATIQSLRRQYSGAVPLSECERHARLVQQAREDRQEAEKLKEEARRCKNETQDKLSELEAQQINLEELITTLRNSSPGSTAARLTEWHSKLGELRLVELRLTRSNQQLNEKIRHLEDVVSTSERAFAKLEQELVTVTKDYESSQLSWEQREAQLEKQLEARTTSGRADRDNVDTQVSLSSSQDMLLQLKTLGREKMMLTQQLQERGEEVRHLEKALSSLRAELLGKENELVELRKMAERPKKPVEVDRDDHQKALASSLDSIKHLKAELSAKEQMAEKYQQMLQDTRKEHEKAISAYRDEAAALREKLNAQADTAFSRLKQAALEAANVASPVVPTDKQLERLLELEDLTIQQKQEVKKLRQEIDAKTQQRDSCEQSYEARISKIKQESKELTQQYRHEMEGLRGSLFEKSGRVTELEQEVEVLEGELSAAQQAAKQAPSRTMKALVERLRNQLSVKEKQQRALSQALLQVRADLVETAQKTLEGEVGKEELETNIHHLVSQKTQELQQQVLYLSSRLDEVKGHLSEHESREMKTLEELERVKRELEARETQVRNMEGELERKWKGLEQAKAREDKLIQKVQQLQSEVENSPKVLELQKRVKVLQGKLDKQKEQTKSLEESLKARAKPQDPVGVSLQEGGAKGEGAVQKPPEGSTAVDKTSAIDRKQQALEIMRWEESKKWQKKLDILRGKLTEKTRDLETLQKQVNTLRDMQSRSDREKNFLNAKVKSLQKQLAEGNEPHHEGKRSEDHKVGELERVIVAMKKVIEKLQTENESLKKSSSRPAKAEGGKKLAAVQEENSKLKMEIEKLQRGTAKPTAIPKSTYDKIVSENDRLVRDYKKEVAKTEKLQLALTTLQIQHDKLTQDVDHFNKSASASLTSKAPPLLFSASSPRASQQHESGGRGELEVRVEQLQAEVEKKTTMLMEVKRHLKEAAERERELKELSTDAQLSEKYLAVVRERDSLKQETVQMRKELNAFDPSFFEEIEDLKFNYHECVRRNVELEDQLSQLISQQKTLSEPDS